MGLSIDSRYSHINWATSLGGISTPLLADMHPKGAVAKAYDMYLDGAGISDRATVLIDAEGVVQYAESVGPGGKRDMEALLEKCEALDAKHNLPDAHEAKGLPEDTVLYIKNSCGFSQTVLNTLENLHMADDFLIKNVSDDEAALAQLEKRGGKNQAPALLTGGDCLYESDEIVKILVEKGSAL